MSTPDFNAIALATGSTAGGLAVTYFVLTYLSTVAAVLKAVFEWIVEEPIRILLAVSVAIAWFIWS